jgi:RNA polymerase sigma-70 factor (ECF subfamily)
MSDQPDPFATAASFEGTGPRRKVRLQRYGEHDEADHELLRRVADADVTALLQLYERYAELIYSLAQRILHDEISADEVLLETFMQVWHEARDFQPSREHIAARIVKIARTLSLTALRRQLLSTKDETNKQGLDTAPSNDLEAGDLRRAQQHLVRNAIAQLPLRQRQVILQAYYGGLTHRELAERMGDPVEIVQLRLRLALQHLETILRSTPGNAWETPKSHRPSDL